MGNSGKRIWIVNYYISPPEFVTHPRHLKFAQYLMQAGYNVTIFSTGFLRDESLDLVPSGKKFEEVNYANYKFVHIKCNHYSGNGIKRMFSIFQFSYRLLIFRRKFEKPDIILHNIHAPFDYLVSVCAKKLRARYVTEAWDLWPYSFVLFGLISASNPLVKIAYKFERKLYEKADQIIFSFEGGIDYILEKGWDIAHGGKVDINKIHYINNGVDLKDFEKDKQLFKLEDADLEDNTSFKVIYLGSIRLVNSVKQLIDAAALLIQNSDIKFLIYGDGSDRVYLEKYVIDNNISNVKFKSRRIPFKYVPYVLSCSSLNILNYEQGVGQYGISSGKLFQYLASGKPVCCNRKMNYCLINKYNLGIAKDFNSVQEYADAILTIKNLDFESYNVMCNRAKEVATQFDMKLLSGKLMKILENI